MKILISNDDGFQAPGIVALHDALKDIAEVEVVAPEHNNSAKSNALTLAAPLYVHKAHNGFRYVTGTPADCVHIALKGLLDYRPDLVVSGINNGANMGDDTIYSGTVGAAMEAYLFGIPAIAFSQIEKGWAHVDAAAQVARRLVQQIEREKMIGGPAFLLNVNVPNRPFDELEAGEGLPARPPPCGGESHHAGQPARRDDVLDRGRRRRQGQRRGHRLPRHRRRPHRAHAAADRPDRPRQPGAMARDGGPSRQLTWPRNGPVFRFA
jgi:5'/3'-nucleotidase SurE